MAIEKNDLNLSSIARLVVLSNAFLLGGCVSAGAHLSEWSSPSEMQDESPVYAGTCYSFLLLSNHNHDDFLGEMLAALAFFDLSGTMALDTLLLPLDLTTDVYRDLKGRPDNKSVCDVLTGS